MPNLSIVSLDDGLAQRATDLAADYWLRGVDAVYVAVAQQFDTTLVTLDPEQGRRAAEVVPVRSPGQVIAQMVRLLT
jgi:predicted nucleic acid-binding protein